MTTEGTIKCPHCYERTDKVNYCQECGKPTNELILLSDIRDELLQLNQNIDEVKDQLMKMRVNR